MQYCCLILLGPQPHRNTAPYVGSDPAEYTGETEIQTGTSSQCQQLITHRTKPSLSGGLVWLSKESTGFWDAPTVGF